MLISLCAKQNCSLWLASFPVAASNLKYNLLPEPSGHKCVKLYRRYQRYLFVCQIILQIMKICVCVWNYTEAISDSIGSCVKFEIIIYYQISVVLVLIGYHRENTHLLVVQKHSNFIYKLRTITAVHCKYIVSDKLTPPTMCWVLTMSTNECIAMGSTHKCKEGYQELLLI